MGLKWKIRQGTAAVQTAPEVWKLHEIFKGHRIERRSLG